MTDRMLQIQSCITDITELSKKLAYKCKYIDIINQD